MRFAIVTPVFNGARFIDETILSVVGQAGPFSVRYHVQDGGSTDGTLDKLAQWRRRLNGDFPVLCDGIEFTYASASDRGVYDAINHGFAATGPDDVMSWINADDRYQPGAFATVAEIMQKFQDIAWLGGRVNLIDESGAPLITDTIVPFPRRAIAAGIFDGRATPHYIQQEGLFWSAWLWRAVGGVDPDFRVAGDFDLWRRFAEHVELMIVNAALGAWRRRAGQISEDKAAYHAEIDGSMTPQEKAHRETMAKRYRKIVFPARRHAAGLDYGVIQRQDSLGDWICERFPLPQSTLKTIWRARRHLPVAFSIRGLIRGLTGS